MKLEPLMEFYANLEPPLAVGEGPFGNRMLVEVKGGEFEGPRLRGKIRELSAADWLIVDADGLGHLDVRATFETHDGAYIYAQYYGTLVVNEKVQAALAGNGDCDYGETEFFITPNPWPLFPGAIVTPIILWKFNCWEKTTSKTTMAPPQTCAPWVPQQ